MISAPKSCPHFHLRPPTGWLHRQWRRAAVASMLASRPVCGFVSAQRLNCPTRLALSCIGLSPCRPEGVVLTAAMLSQGHTRLGHSLSNRARSYPLGHGRLLTTDNTAFVFAKGALPLGGRGIRGVLCGLPLTKRLTCTSDMTTVDACFRKSSYIADSRPSLERASVGIAWCLREVVWPNLVLQSQRA